MGTKTWTDPVVEEVRAHRAAIFREAGSNLRVLAKRLMESQQRHGKKLVTKEDLEGRAKR
jgi:hypothetical protein